MRTLTSTLVMVGIVFSAVSTFAQKVLPGITIRAANYKYLNAVKPEEAAPAVNMLEQYVATYEITGAEFYDEVYDNYIVSFYIPSGKILAAYDKEGNILHTAEKFKDVAVPSIVSQAVARRFPNWAIAKDVYLVSYYEKDQVSSRIYKLLLENDGKRIRVKVNEAGEFL